MKRLLLGLALLFVSSANAKTSQSVFCDDGSAYQIRTRLSRTYIVKERRIYYDIFGTFAHYPELGTDFIFHAGRGIDQDVLSCMPVSQ